MKTNIRAIIAISLITVMSGCRIDECLIDPYDYQSALNKIEALENAMEQDSVNNKVDIPVEVPVEVIPQSILDQVSTLQRDLINNYKSISTLFVDVSGEYTETELILNITNLTDEWITFGRAESIYRIDNGYQRVLTDMELLGYDVEYPADAMIIDVGSTYTWKVRLNDYTFESGSYVYVKEINSSLDNKSPISYAITFTFEVV